MTARLDDVTQWLVRASTVGRVLHQLIGFGSTDVSSFAIVQSDSMFVALKGFPTPVLIPGQGHMGCRTCNRMGRPPRSSKRLNASFRQYSQGQIIRFSDF